MTQPASTSPAAIIPGYLRQTPDGCSLALRAQPGAKKTAFTGIYGSGPTAQLKLAVQAPPIEGRANEAIIRFLADTFQIPRASVEILSGELNRSKVFLLKGITVARVAAMLSVA